MANSFPSNVVLTADKFADFKLKAAQLARYTHDFSADIASKGTGVTIWWQTPTTASQWTAATKYQLADETVQTATVTIGEPYYAQAHLTPNEQASYGEDFLYKRSGPLLSAVVDKIKVEAQTRLTSSIFPAVTVSASLMTFNAVLSGSSVLVNSGSVGPVTLLANTNGYNALISEAKTANYAITTEVSEGQNSFKYTLLPNVKIIQEASMPSGFSVMTTPDAVGIVLRQTPQLSSYNRSTVLEGDTGLTLPLDLVEDGPGGVIMLRPSVSAAFAVGRPGAAVRYVHP